MLKNVFIELLILPTTLSLKQLLYKMFQKTIKKNLA